MPYTFKPTQYGTIEVLENGKRITTATPSYAAQQYGYGGATPSPVINPLAPVIPPQILAVPTTASVGIGVQSVQAGLDALIKSINEKGITDDTGKVLLAPSSGATVTTGISGITSGDLETPVTPISVPQIAPTNTANAIVAGAESTSKSIQDYIKMLTGQTAPEQTTYDTLMGQLNEMIGGAGGRGAAQAAAEAAGGIPGLKTSLANVNSEILRKIAEYKALSTDVEGKPITMASIIGSQAQIQKVMASDIGLLQAQALGLQGQLTAAQDTADRSVDLKYQDVTDDINLRLKQLELLKGQLTDKETIRLKAIELYLNDQKTALSTQIANEKDKNATLLNQMQKYPDAGITLGDTIESANRKIQQNSKIYQKSIKETGGEEIARGEEIVFTDTQISKGAATANMPISDFSELDIDSKNFFINNSDQIKNMKKIIDEAAAKKEDAESLEKEISEGNLSEIAKDSLVKYLWTVFPRPSEQSKPWWKIW